MAPATHSGVASRRSTAGGPNIPIKQNAVARFPINYDVNNQNGCIQVTGVSPSHNDFLRTVLAAVGAEVASVGSATGVDSMQLNKALLSELLV